MSKRRLSFIIVVGIAVTLTLSLLCQGRLANPARAEEVKGRKEESRLSEFDRQRLEEGGPAVVKQFVVGMRYGDERIADLQKLIDPRYLNKHRLTNRELSFQRFATKSIFELQQADDPQTVLCTASTEESTRETFLFRTTIYVGQVYLLPLSPPDPTTGIYKPWILRTKQISSSDVGPTAGDWKVVFANGVSQVCQLREDGTASVVEPQRSSAGKSEVKQGATVIVYADDRVERWTPIGPRRVVEHWFPASRYPQGTPVLGVAERAQ